MLQEIDHIEATYVCFDKVVRFDQFEQRKITILIIPSLGTVMMRVHYDLRLVV